MLTKLAIDYNEYKKDIPTLFFAFFKVFIHVSKQQR